MNVSIKMKRIIILSLCVFVLSFVLVSGIEEYSLLNSSVTQEAKVIMYEITDINFDHTFNTLLITSKNLEISLDYSNEEMFHIWDFYVEIDNEPYYYSARPQIGEDEDRFNFKFSIPVNGTQFIKINYFMNNVKQERAEWLYPFDSYSLFLKNYKIIDGLAFSKKLNFPQVDISPKIDIKYQANLNIEGYPDKLNFSISPKIAGSKYSKVIGGICLINKKMCNIGWAIFDQNIYGEWKKLDIPIEILTPVKEQTGISFSRNNFSKYLFVILVIYLFLISIYYVKEKPLFKERLYNIYVKASILPWMISEFTVGVSPPYRPICVTLFDLIIFLPLIITLIATPFYNDSTIVSFLFIAFKFFLELILFILWLIFVLPFIKIKVLIHKLKKLKNRIKFVDD